MKIRTIVAATSAALFSLGAIAAGDEQKQSQSQGAEKSQGAQGSSSGQKSDIVKQAQQKLSQAGHDVKADGVMGPKTQAALKEFQQAKGIEASGQLNKDTLAALGVSGEVTTGSAATGGSTSGQSQSKSSSPAASGSSSGSSSGQSQQPAASGSSSGQSQPKKY